MRSTLFAASSALAIALAASGALAQESAPEPTPLVNVRDQAVLTFTPDFFAAQRPNTALDMVNRVPGFRVEDGDGGRGFEGAVGNILINGSRPASKNDTGSSVMSRTPATRVERIELIRGGAPGIDMQGYSLVVNVILEGGASRESVLTGEAYLFDGGQNLFGGSYRFTSSDGDRTWGFTLSDGISMSDSNGEGPAIRRDADGNVIRREDYYNDGYGGSTSLRGNYAAPMLGGRADLTARYGVDDWHSIDQLSAGDDLRDSRYDDDGTFGEFGVVYTRPLGAGLNLESRFIHEFETFDEVATYSERIGGVLSPEQRFESQGDSSETILRGLVRWEHSEALTFEGGGEVAYNRLDTEQTFSIGGTAVPLPSASVTVEETRGELFGKSTWRITPDLSLEGGLRLEHSTISQSGDADQEKSFFFAKPRALLTWTPMPNNQLRVRFEREVDQLDFGDFAASAELDDQNVLGGNVDLEPEDRWVGEAVYEVRFWGDGVISLGYRHDRIENVIDRIPLEDGLSAVGNIGEGTLDRLSANIVIPLSRFGFSGGQFTFRNDWNSTEVTDPTTGETRPISQIRARQAVIGLRQDIPSWNINWNVAWIPRLGQATYSPDQIVGWEGSDYLEMAVEYKPTPTLSLRAQLNIWDDFEVTRTVFADRSNPRPIDFVEVREIDPRTFVQLRLRKTF